MCVQAPTLGFKGLAMPPSLKEPHYGGFWPTLCSPQVVPARVQSYAH